MSIESSDNTRDLWVKRKGKLSQSDFTSKYPHPFLLVGSVAEEASDDFFTHPVGTNGRGDSVQDEDQEIIPLLKGGANPYSDRIIIGRARNCDIVFRNSSVSKVHADLQVLGADSCDVVDRASTNGTIVGHDRIVAGEKIPVKSGGQVCFGTVRCVFISSSELFRLL